MLHCLKKLDYLCNCKSEISNVFQSNALEGHCLEAMKIVHHHANGCFSWLIFEHQSVNPSRTAISILSGKYKRFTFVHPVKEPYKKTLFPDNHSVSGPIVSAVLRHEVLYFRWLIFLIFNTNLQRNEAVH